MMHLKFVKKGVIFQLRFASSRKYWELLGRFPFIKNSENLKALTLLRDSLG